MTSKRDLDEDVILTRIAHNIEMKNRAIQQVNDELALRKCNNCIYVQQERNFLGFKKYRCLIINENISMNDNLTVDLYNTKQALGCPSYKNKLGL